MFNSKYPCGKCKRCERDFAYCSEEKVAECKRISLCTRIAAIISYIISAVIFIFVALKSNVSLPMLLALWAVMDIIVYFCILFVLIRIFT